MRSSKELGYVDFADQTYAGNTTGTIVLLNTIAQGAGTSQRVGKRVVLKSLQCKGHMTQDSGGTVNTASMIIVYDIRPTGVVPAITDILAINSSAGFPNDANSDRFRILKRVDYTLCGTSAGTTGNSGRELNFYLKLKDLPQVFKAAGTGSIGDIAEGAIYCVTTGYEAAGVNDINIFAAFRLRYMDL